MTTFWSAIINGAILSAVLSLAAGLFLRATPRGVLNAATRYAIWWSVLAATLALPLSHVELVTVKSALPRAQNLSVPVSMPASRVDVQAAAQRVSSGGFSLPLEISAVKWQRPLFLFWIACSVCFLMRVFLSYAALYRSSTRAVSAPEDWNARVAGWLPGRQVRLAISAEIAIPVATGPFCPAILVPATLLGQISPDDLEQIGRHEAAHLARRDDCALFLQRLIEAAFSLHPVVRWLTRQIDLEREIACDDIVAGSTENPRSYAECLTRMVVLCGGVSPSLAATSMIDGRSHLSRRVELLVENGRTFQTRLLLRQFLGITFALICAMALLVKTPILVAFAVPNTVIAVPPQVVPPHESPAPVQSVVKAPTTRPRPELLAQAAPAPPPAPPPVPSPLPLYVLGANDIIGVTVADQPHVSATYAIAPDGQLSMPLIGKIKADGLTIPDLTAVITARLRDDGGIPEPVVSVQLIRNNSKRYTLVGATHRTGVVPLLETTTVLDALTESGFKPYADRKKIFLKRGAKIFDFDYDEVIRGKNLDQNITIEDGDLIVVTE